MTISNRMPPTSISSDSRSSTWASDRAGGQVNSFGTTDHSLASTMGITTRPRLTCRPCVSRYSQTGRVGQSKYGSRSQPGWAGNAWPNLGAYAAKDSRPGDDHHRQRDQEHQPEHRRQPGPPQRAPPGAQPVEPRRAVPLDGAPQAGRKAVVRLSGRRLGAGHGCSFGARRRGRRTCTRCHRHHRRFAAPPCRPDGVSRKRSVSIRRPALTPRAISGSASSRRSRTGVIT